jgi:amino acid permease
MSSYRDLEPGFTVDDSGNAYFAVVSAGEFVYSYDLYSLFAEHSTDFLKESFAKRMEVVMLMQYMAHIENGTRM